MTFHTSQYSGCFIPATTKLWNEFPSMIVEATELQKFKTGANAFLLGVDGLYPSFLNIFFILLTFNLVLSNLLLLLLLFSFIVVFFSFESFLFPYWVVFPAGAFRFLVFGSPSWCLQSGI